ncbi:MAG: hypothetical protein ABI626_08510 [Sphingomicrobium sp.]
MPLVSGRWWRPPARLRPIPERAAGVLRLLWIALFVIAITVDLGGTAYVLRNTYQVRPVFERIGLDFHIEYEGDVQVGTLPDASGRQRIDTVAHIVAIDGKPIAANALVADIVHRIEAAPGPRVAVDLRQPDGRLVQLDQLRQTGALALDRARDLRLAMRLGVGLIACVTLLMCSLILALRRPNDPVAMLFAFAFAGMAATIDPPLQMWMGLGLALIDDIIASTWFYLLLLAFTVFPDGIFVPRSYRWLLILGIPLAIFLSLDSVDENLQMLLGIGTLLAVLVGQVRRYRRLPRDIERQQIKYAAFGFAMGLLMITAAMIITTLIPETGGPMVWARMTVLVLFSLGMAIIPLGLLIALTRFRLWEADTVISRSAAYAVVTLFVGAVWAASSDLVKLLVGQVMGSDSQASATAVSALLAAGIFSPTQAVVLGWTRRRFGGPLDRIKGAAERLKKWGLTETPEEIGTRALSLVEETIHPAAAAIAIDTPRGPELLAGRGCESLDDHQLVERLPLADEESSVGELRLSRRSDGNRYNRNQLEAVRAILPALADALRVARSRHSRDSMLQERLEEMAARLAQLEGGGAAKPA